MFDGVTVHHCINSLVFKTGTSQYISLSNILMIGLTKTKISYKLSAQESGNMCAMLRPED